MEVYKFLSYKITKFSKFFRIKQQMNILGVVILLGFSINFLLNIIIYNKLNKILTIIDKNKSLKDKNDL